jgi:hypothetical protein
MSLFYSLPQSFKVLVSLLSVLLLLICLLLDMLELFSQVLQYCVYGRIRILRK